MAIFHSQRWQIWQPPHDSPDRLGQRGAAGLWDDVVDQVVRKPRRQRARAWGKKIS